MSIEIKYTDGFGSEISSEQQRKLVNYDKLTFDSGNLKMIESFHQSRGIDYGIIKYFLSPEENKTDLLQHYSSAVNNVSCIFYFNKQFANNINLWDYEEYRKDEKLYFKGKQAFDALNRLVFVCGFDLATNQLKDRAKKYYYGAAAENSTNDSILWFTYDSNGDLNSITDIQEKFGYNESISLDEYLADTDFSQIDFPWNQHPYYHAVTPYLPTGDL
jgi:hypothetical protein